jgi:hypothetical protein
MRGIVPKCGETFNYYVRRQRRICAGVVFTPKKGDGGRWRAGDTGKGTTFG